uniref:Homeobox domain-containing protein n=1 Tax=Anopheles epiroticus TaxID=199890 RepID=A0A182P2H6_9DIPT
MKMGSSKRKSSFRIDDILHQQRVEQQNLLYQHHHAGRLPATASTASSLSSDTGSALSLGHTAAGSYSNGLQSHGVPTDCSTPPGSPVLASPLAVSSGSNGGSVRSESPKKPTAMYPGLLDFSKNVIPIPLQFGMPAFNPLNAAYLEHYASVLHKGKTWLASPRVWPFYPHPYSYLLPTCGSKRKGGQVRFTPQQTQSLEKRFSNHKYLSPEDRRNLAVQLKLSDRQVKTWFQNRRAKWRRANSGCQSTDVLGSADSLGDAAKGSSGTGTMRTQKYSSGNDEDDDGAVDAGEGAATDIGDYCLHNDQCQYTLSTGNSECRDNSCQCVDGAHYVEREKRCYKTSFLGEYCRLTNNCIGNDTYCRDGICVCTPGKHPNADRNRCLHDAKLGDQCFRDEECVTDNSRCAQEICTCRVSHVLNEQRNRCLPSMYEPVSLL